MVLRDSADTEKKPGSCPLFLCFTETCGASDDVRLMSVNDCGENRSSGFSQGVTPTEVKQANATRERKAESEVSSGGGSSSTSSGNSSSGNQEDSGFSQSDFRQVCESFLCIVRSCCYVFHFF